MTVAIPKLGNSVAKQKPMQIRKNRCDVAEPRFLCDYMNPPKTLYIRLIFNFPEMPIPLF